MKNDNLNKLIRKLEYKKTKLLSKEFNAKDMIGKKIITFGTFDLLHIGHQKIINHAIEITGEEKNVIIGVSSDSWNFKKGKKSFESQEERKKHILEKYPNVTVVFEDHNFPEETWPTLFDEFNVDCIVMGGDHYKNLSYINGKKTPKGKEMKIIFFERTPKISSTLIRKKLKTTKN